MHNNTYNVLIASLKAGLLPALLTPILWPLVILIVEGKFPNLSTYSAAIMPIIFFALTIGTICCITLGVPTLLILQKLKIIKPKITAIIALFYAGVLFYIFSPSLEQAAMNKSWQIYIVLGSLGAICGYIASYLSCPNKALKRTHERAA